jgi:hypothetical protein
MIMRIRSWLRQLALQRQFAPICDGCGHYAPLVLIDFNTHERFCRECSHTELPWGLRRWL